MIIKIIKEKYLAHEEIIINILGFTVVILEIVGITILIGEFI